MSKFTFYLLIKFKVIKEWREPERKYTNHYVTDITIITISHYTNHYDVFNVCWNKHILTYCRKQSQIQKEEDAED